MDRTVGNWAWGLLGSLAIVITLACPASAEGAKAWRQWGGASRDFKVADGVKLADGWGADGPRKLWSRSLGDGYAAIVSEGGKLFTMYRNGDEDVIVCLDAATGKTVWETKYAAKTHPDNVLNFGTGPNSTPLIIGDRLVTHGFTGVLSCVRLADGAMQWQHDLVKDFGGLVLKFGTAASPVAHDGKVVVLVGGEKMGVAAFNPADGKIVWQSEPLEVSYATPVLIDVDGQPQFVVMTAEEAVGIAADGGKVLWRHPCKHKYRNNCTDPLWGPGNLLWVATQQDAGTRVLHLTQSGGKTQVGEVWADDKIRVFHWNALLLDGHVYAASGDSVQLLSAVELATGKVLWRERGYPKANLIAADGKVIALDAEGQLSLLRVSPRGLEVLGQAQVLEKEAWTVPTLVGSTLYARDRKNIVALDLAR
jgi:outer membrane protein assembly factor BamB